MRLDVLPGTLGRCPVHGKTIMRVASFSGFAGMPPRSQKVIMQVAYSSGIPRTLSAITGRTCGRMPHRERRGAVPCMGKAIMQGTCSAGISWTLPAIAGKSMRANAPSGLQRCRPVPVRSGSVHENAAGFAPLSAAFSARKTLINVPPRSMKEPAGTLFAEIAENHSHPLAVFAVSSPPGRVD